MTTAHTEELHAVRLVVNGAAHDVRLPARRLLSDALRHDLGLTGTHVGCEHGVCGACTVLLDGTPVRACLLFAVSVAGQEITTVEGLTNDDGTLGPVQQAFKECHGLQCGFCTPGFLTTITAGLEENPSPTEDEAREMVGGNLCRCTGYQNIAKAVCRAAELRSAGAGGAGVAGFETVASATSSTTADPLVESGTVASATSSTTGDPLVEEGRQGPSRNQADEEGRQGPSRNQADEEDDS